MPYKRIEDKIAYNKRYYEENKEKIKEKAIQYYKNNCEKCKERSKKYSKQYYENNREKKYKQHKIWRGNNNEKYIEYRRKHNRTEKGKATNQRTLTMRRAREEEIINTLTSEEWLDILEKHNYLCAYCGTEFDCENLPTRDHVIPISKGGDNIKENVVPACRSCNAKKHTKILVGGNSFG